MTDTLMWSAILFAAILTLAGCAHAPPAPAGACGAYTVEQPVGDWVGDWFGDAGPTILTVKNTCPYAVRATVACPSSDPESDGWAYWPADLAPRGAVTVLMQEPARDTRVQSCHVASKERTP